eukprot:1087108-Alexandrium_andersonii.AAC.1
MEPPHHFGDDGAPSPRMARPARNVTDVYDKYVCTTSAARWCKIYNNVTMGDLAARRPARLGTRAG